MAGRAHKRQNAGRWRPGSGSVKVVEGHPWIGDSPSPAHAAPQDDRANDLKLVVLGFPPPVHPPRARPARSGSSRARSPGPPLRRPLRRPGTCVSPTRRSACGAGRRRGRGSPRARRTTARGLSRLRHGDRERIRWGVALRRAQGYLQRHDPQHGHRRSSIYLPGRGHSACGRRGVHHAKWNGLRPVRADAGGKGWRRDAPTAARRGNRGVRPAHEHGEHPTDCWFPAPLIAAGRCAHVGGGGGRAGQERSPLPSRRLSAGRSEARRRGERHPRQSGCAWGCRRGPALARGRTLRAEPTPLPSLATRSPRPTPPQPLRPTLPPPPVPNRTSVGRERRWVSGFVPCGLSVIRSGRRIRP